MKNKTLMPLNFLMVKKFLMVKNGSFKSLAANHQPFFYKEQ